MITARRVGQNAWMLANVSPVERRELPALSDDEMVEMLAHGVRFTRRDERDRAARLLRDVRRERMG